MVLLKHEWAISKLVGLLGKCSHLLGGDSIGVREKRWGKESTVLLRRNSWH